LNNFKKEGFLVVKNKVIKSHIIKAKTIFKKDFSSRFGKNTSINRELIKRFTDHPFISSIYTSKIIVNILNDIGLKIPVKCGPLVSHYTANNKTGNSYGLPYHQDYPSMASSKSSVILWLNLVDCNKATHGIEIIQGAHSKGLLQGQQRKIGYVLNKKYSELKSIIPLIKAGDLLIMSSFLPHRTFVNPNFKKWKLSLSQRYDDLADKDWKRRGFKNAYQISVDRKLFFKIA